MHRMQVFKGIIFCCVRFCGRKCCCTIFAVSHTRGVAFFIWKRSRRSKIVSNILKSLFYQKLVKIVSSDKRQSHTGFTFSSCLVITDSELSEKVVYWSIIFSKLDIYLWKFEHTQWFKYNFANINYSVSFHK